ncbi:DinB family protein [Chitinophaga agrisoli]|uniref:DinB family protein n=1 Tax=Chitinophaga agrisoli TaxID=2607653 RepID=A0A5B2VQ34_9BACT|nr:DinB family protein [Chitinophaga agrisoli]KAA2241873.1 DinB family protein [Chitinophaga agrisoli]
MSELKQEVWLRGPVNGIPALLQPVAHALLQAQEEIHALLADFPASRLWERPAGLASVGFHLQHLSGVLDRLFTYANGQTLSAQQLQYLAAEGVADENIQITTLLAAFDVQIAQALTQLKDTDPAALTDIRTVGRKQVPSTMLGLLFHAAEHTMRHTGQLLATVRFVRL